MKKKSKSKNKITPPRVDPYLEGLMAKLLERLTGLERKLDTVVALSAGKSSAGSDQTKPFQSAEVKQQQLPPRRDRVLHEAICADCHKVCEVPFRPSEDRPVYCKECFAKRKSGGSGKIYPVLTPVALPSKLTHKPQTVKQPAQSAKSSSKKTNKKKKKK